MPRIPLIWLMTHRRGRAGGGCARTWTLLAVNIYFSRAADWGPYLLGQWVPHKGRDASSFPGASPSPKAAPIFSSALSFIFSYVSGGANPLLPRVGNLTVGLEQGADIQRLAAP